jgi:hypothetical protein
VGEGGSSGSVASVGSLSVPRLTALDASTFEKMVAEGSPFVVSDAIDRSVGFAMRNWTCDEFARRFPDAAITHHYVQVRWRH